jgi:hypothetical protein
MEKVLVALGLPASTYFLAADLDLTDEGWKVAERFGLWAALCLGLIIAVMWFGWKREVRMATRIDTLEANKEQIAVELHDNGEKLGRTTELLEEQVRLMQSLCTEMRCRPCLKERRDNG